MIVTKIDSRLLEFEMLLHVILVENGRSDVKFDVAIGLALPRGVTEQSAAHVDALVNRSRRSRDRLVHIDLRGRHDLEVSAIIAAQDAPVLDKAYNKTEITFTTFTRKIGKHEEGDP